MKNYVLHFIRHGATEHQQKGVYMGRRTGSELSAEGIGELLALRREYDYPPVEVVFSSPLPHCLQTADFLYPESRLMVVDELAEMDFGSYEGKTLEQLKDWTAKLTDALRAQNRLQVAVPTVFTAAPAVLDAFKDTVEGYKLQSMGVILSYICPLMYMNNPLCKKKAVITNSNKLRTYTSARYYTDAEILDILTEKEGR